MRINLAKNQLLPAFFLIAAGFLVYSNSFNGPFFFDDIPSIPENPHIRSLWPLWKAWVAPAQSSLSGRPVASLSFALNYALGGTQLWTYHLFNLGIHIFCALIFLGCMRRVLLAPRWKGKFENAAPRIAFSAALLWLVHPLLADAVDYVIQRTELLGSFFFLLTHYCVIRSIENSKVKAGIYWQIVAVIFCALGMMSKEFMVGAPLLALLLDRTFYTGSFSESLKQRKGMYLGMALTWIILAVIVASGPRNETVSLHFPNLTPWQYLLTQSGVLLHYLRLAVWPSPLVIDYHDWPIASSPMDVIVPGTLILLLLALTLYAIRRNEPFGFIWGSFFLILAPTSSFVPIITEIAAEKRMYLPLTVLMASQIIYMDGLIEKTKLSQFFKKEKIFWVFIFSMIVSYGGMTFQRNVVFQNEVAIWEDVLASRPSNARAHNNLGLALVAAGRRPEAAQHYAEALRLKPAYVDAYINLGNFFLDQKKWDEAVKYYEQALKLKPDDARALTNFGSALFHQGRIDEAIAYHRKALDLKPDDAHVYNNLGAALTSLNQTDEAEALYLKALEIRPDFPEIHSNLGSIYAGKGQADLAEKHYQEALRLKPEYAKAANNYGNLLIQKERYQEAVGMFSAALRLEPDYAEAHNNLAVAYANLGKLDDAIREYGEALRLRPDSAEIQVNLATVLSDQGKKEEAAVHLKEALRLKPGSAEIQKKLEKIRDGSL